MRLTKLHKSGNQAQLQTLQVDVSLEPDGPVCFPLVPKMIKGMAADVPSHHLQHLSPDILSDTQNHPLTMNSPSSTKTVGMGGLGNHATLEKIDKLRELNVGAVIPLPQVSPDPALPTQVVAKAEPARRRRRPVLREELCSRKSDRLLLPPRRRTLYPLRDTDHLLPRPRVKHPCLDHSAPRCG